MLPLFDHLPTRRRSELAASSLRLLCAHQTSIAHWELLYSVWPPPKISIFSKITPHPGPPLSTAPYKSVRRSGRLHFSSAQHHATARRNRVTYRTIAHCPWPLPVAVLHSHTEAHNQTCHLRRESHDGDDVLVPLEAGCRPVQGVFCRSFCTMNDGHENSRNCRWSGNGLGTHWRTDEGRTYIQYKRDAVVMPFGRTCRVTRSPASKLYISFPRHRSILDSIAININQSSNQYKALHKL